MAENHVEMTEEQKQCVNKALNNALWEKMKREQEQYRAALLKQSPADILRQADLYALREMIVDVMDTYDLTDLRAAALLNCEHPLQEVAMEYRENMIPMDDVIDCLEHRANALIGGMKQKEESLEMQEPKYDVIEVCGHRALFSNGRIPIEEVPEGLYRYQLRHGDDGEFSSLEKSVMVNHGGTVLTREPIDFGGEDYIVFDDETSPNFLGEHATLTEFLEEEPAESPCQSM